MSETSTQTLPEGLVLTLTDNAVTEVRKFIAAENVPAETGGLRVSVLPGGCSRIQVLAQHRRSCGGR